MTSTLALFGPLGGWEVVILGIVGLLIFGKRLPEVGRSLGKGIVEFKKGLQGIEDDVNQVGARPAPRLDADKPAPASSPQDPPPPQT